MIVIKAYFVIFVNPKKCANAAPLILTLDTFSEAVR
jgi:hypothetical protein